MSEKKKPVGKASVNKNIRKLRAISAVCSLTSSWQRWVSDNQSKQASEPSGWTPASLGGPEKPKKTWEPKKPAPEAPKEAPAPSRIKTKQVVKTVSSGVQEKSAGVGLLTEKIQKERPESGEEIDQLLKKKSSPTRRRKCSNMVSSLTKSWKQVENEQKTGRDGGRTSRTEEERSGSGRTSRTEDERSGSGRTSRTEEERSGSGRTSRMEEERSGRTSRTEDGGSGGRTSRMEDERSGGSGRTSRTEDERSGRRTSRTEEERSGRTSRTEDERSGSGRISRTEEERSGSGRTSRTEEERSGRTSRTEDERSGERTSRTEDEGRMEVEKKLDREDGGSLGGRTSRTDVEKNLDEEDKLKTNFNKEEEEMSSEEDSAVRIKRPSAQVFRKKEAEDANKINALSKKFSAVGSLKSRWQTWASEHSVSQKLNPFSEYFDYDYSMSLRLQKGQDGYGRPKEGTKTAERAKRAEQHIHREIDDMCYVIRTMADPDPDGKTRVTFGQLFDRYVRISDKVVGILMRARKHRKVAFEGEMLWQGQDDDVIITLLV